LKPGGLFVRPSDADGDIDIAFEGIQRAAETPGRPERFVTKAVDFFRRRRFTFFFLRCLFLIFLLLSVENLFPGALRIARARALGFLCDRVVD
jgi:hypothetical protein